jgi:LuxR family maltose regulon positive regulatory protein
VAPELAGELDTTREVEALILARVLIARGQSEPGRQTLHVAHRLLARLRDDAAAHGHTGSLIETLAVAALADAAAGHRDQALGVLQQALLLAMPEGYARIFLDEGAPMRLLIADCRSALSTSITLSMEWKDSHLLRAYLEQLLAAFPRTEGRGLRTESTESTSSILNPQPSALVESLSERELEVLRLIANGASNQAIAAALVISIGTVKSHINHILGKLAACNRTEAVSRARTLGLLMPY